MFTSTLLLLLIIIISCGQRVEPQVKYDYLHDFERDLDYRNLNLGLSKTTKQTQIGQDVELDCGITENKSIISSKSPVSWHFKPCGHIFNQSACNKGIESQDSTSWKNLECAPNDHCNSTLAIINATEKDSGLYRCSIYPFKPNSWTTLEIQVVKTYFLDVRNTRIPLPDVVEGPRNTTALIDSQVVLQCFVYSSDRPRITWFKKQESPIASSVGISNTSNKVIEYFKNNYVPLESAGEKALSNGIYLSKLILNGVTNQDAGFYVCVAMNYGGYKVQEAHLTIVDSEDERGDEYEAGNSTHSLFLLFLIPVGLALAPLTLWICYLLFRKRKDKVVDDKVNKKRQNYVQVNRNIV